MEIAAVTALALSVPAKRTVRMHCTRSPARVVPLTGVHVSVEVESSCGSSARAGPAQANAGASAAAQAMSVRRTWDGSMGRLLLATASQHADARLPAT
jgi:hypothetical protein